MRWARLFLLLTVLCGPLEVAAGTWFLGVERNADRNHDPQDWEFQNLFFRSLLAGRRLDSGWSLTISMGASHRESARPTDGPDTRNDGSGRWLRFRLGRPLITDGPFEIGCEVQIHTADSRSDDWRDNGAGNSIHLDSHGVALVLRPEVRVRRSLRVSTTFGIQRIVSSRFMRSRSPDGVLSETRGTIRSWDDFAGIGEYTLTVTYDL